MGVLSLVFVLLCIILCPFLFSNHLDEEERAGCLDLSIFLLSCDCKCSVILPYGAGGGSAACGFGIS